MKIWVMTLILAVGFALLPSCREKSLTNSRVVVTAVGIDAGEEADCRLSIQAIETLKTSGSLTEQAENATKVYDIEAPSVAGALQSFVTRTGRSSYILHNRAVVIGLEQAQRRPLSALLDYFIRNHEGRSTVDMAVCRGEAAEGDSLFPWDGEKRFPNKEIGEFEGAAAESLFSAGEPAFSFWEVFSSDGADGKKAFLRKLNSPKLSIPEKNPLISQFSPKIAAKARHFCLL